MRAGALILRCVETNRRMHGPHVQFLRIEAGRPMASPENGHLRTVVARMGFIRAVASNGGEAVTIQPPRSNAGWSSETPSPIRASMGRWLVTVPRDEESRPLACGYSDTLFRGKLMVTIHSPVRHVLFAHDPFSPISRGGTRHHYSARWVSRNRGYSNRRSTS